MARASATGDRVILLHGVMMRGLTLWPLARRLRGHGYRAELLDYASLLQGPFAGVDKLARRLLTLGEDGPVHLVGHSLGGLVALETIANHAGLPPGRVLCLGSPLAGSSAARGLARNHLGFWLGRSGTLLRSGLGALPDGREVAVIAGSKSKGMGRLFANFDGLNDGTVAVWETRLPGLADHRVLPDSHIGLLLDHRVADLAAGYLRDGRFPA